MDDFDAFLQKKKRKDPPTGQPPAKKFTKLGEAAALREQEVLAKRKAEEEKKKIEDEERERELAEQLEKQRKAEEKKELEKFATILPLQEVLRRLRARQEPVTLFGESELERIGRLHDLELKKPLEYTFDENGNGIATKKEDKNYKIEDRTPEDRYDEILFWCRERLDKMQKSVYKKGATLTDKDPDILNFEETKLNIRPLLIMCRKKTIPDEIMQYLEIIVQCCKGKMYEEANSAYCDLSIGKMAWPMGVTMVGIHDRSAREKISVSKAKHLMNDETQRNYVLSIKRLMTFSEQHDPR